MSSSPFGTTTTHLEEGAEKHVAENKKKIS